MDKETIIEGKLLQDISEFCKLNEIPDTTTFINKLLRDAYMAFKWMDNVPTPVNTPQTEEKKELINTENKPSPSEPKKFFGDSKNSDLYGE